MPKKKYLITLSDDEHEQLEQLLRSGTPAPRKVTRARMRLKTAEGWDDSAIAEALSVGRATVERLRQRFVECGLEALAERPRPGTQPTLDEKAAACSKKRPQAVAKAAMVPPGGERRVCRRQGRRAGGVC